MLSQPASVEGGGEPRRRATSGFNRLLERDVEGPLGDPPRLDLVQDSKLRIHARPRPDAWHTARLQKPWIVVIQARSPSRAARAMSAARSEFAPVRRLSRAPADRRRWTRSRSSPAARSVKVKARMRSGRDLVLGHAVAVALDEDAGLPGPGPRLGEDVTVPRRDRGPLRGSVRSDTKPGGSTSGSAADEGELFGVTSSRSALRPWLSPPAACFLGRRRPLESAVGW